MTAVKNRRKFTLSSDRLDYVIALLKHEMESSEIEILMFDDMLYPGSALMISNDIRKLLENHRVYEYKGPSDKVIPIINPSTVIISNLNAKPLSNCSLNFLTNFRSFLDSKQRIQLERE